MAVASETNALSSLNGLLSPEGVVGCSVDYRFDSHRNCPCDTSIKSIVSAGAVASRSLYTIRQGSCAIEWHMLDRLANTVLNDISGTPSTGEINICHVEGNSVAFRLGEVCTHESGRLSLRINMLHWNRLCRKLKLLSRSLKKQEKEQGILGFYIRKPLSWETVGGFQKFEPLLEHAPTLHSMWASTFSVH